MPGKVYLIGAGPGDPGLMTLKGKAALERADCVIHDVLINAALLRFTRDDCERISAGSLGPDRQTRQIAINRLLVSKSREGRIVARLKGGDPFVFGRGGEEAEALAKAGIAFEVVPGITSGYAAPAYAGIPVTHRDFTTSVSFVAGHQESLKPESAVDWEGLAKGSGTLVFFMGTGTLEQIAHALVKHGRAPETPAAVIRWGTRPNQEVVTGTLADIAARAAHLEPPTVIVVGEVVTLREQLRWFERLPLFGKRIVITRAREQAGALREELSALGAGVVEIPTIEIRPPASWEPLDAAIRRLEGFNYLLFTSANGVRNFLDRLKAGGQDVRDLKGLTIGAIGPATAAELAKTGIRVDLLPREYRAEGLLEALKDRDLRGKAFLIPRAKVARDLVPRALAEKGARVEVVEAYETVVPQLPREELERLFTPPPDVITFTSSSTASNFAKLAGEENVASILRGVAIASIGPVTSTTLRKLGLNVSIEPSESTIPALIAAVVEFFKRRE